MKIEDLGKLIAEEPLEYAKKFVELKVMLEKRIEENEKLLTMCEGMEKGLSAQEARITEMREVLSYYYESPTIN